MDAQLERALELLRHDLIAGGVPELRVEDRPWAEPERASVMLFGPDGSGSGAAITLGTDPAAQVVELADHVQEWAVEALWRAELAPTWPSCPHHPDSHPMAAHVVDGHPMWTCPRDQVTVVEVGALAPDRTPSRPRRRRR